MADILHDIDIAYGWIWAKNPKSIQPLAQVVEDALARFQQRFSRLPDIALVHHSEDTETFKFEFPVVSSQYVLKDTIVLGVLRDFTTEIDKTPRQ